MAVICDLLGTPKTDDLGKYLGFPTIHGRVTKSTYQEVMKRVDSKLAGYKAKWLSLAGQTTLIQASVNAIPTYTMQIAQIPMLVCDELERKIRRFLWGGTRTERKTHLVAWDVVTRDKKGGLGLYVM